LNSAEDLYFILHEELLFRFESFFVHDFNTHVRSFFLIDTSIEMVEDSIFNFETLQKITYLTIFLKCLEPKLVELKFISN